MGDSGMSDSKFMKCQDIIRSHYKIYNKYVKKIPKEKPKKTWYNWIKRLFK